MLKINVIQKDIARSRKLRNSYGYTATTCCPIACAVERMYPKSYYMIGGITITFNGKLYKTTDIMSSYQAKWDIEHIAIPRTFIIQEIQ